MSDLSRLRFTPSRPLTLGVELELQLVSLRDYDLTRAATDLLAGLRYDDRFGEIKLEITESMIEVNSRPRQDVTAIAADLDGLRAQRRNLRLIAPADGLVAAREADPGTTVVAGQTVIEIIDPASLWINVRFDQIVASGLAGGLPARRRYSL